MRSFLASILAPLAVLALSAPAAGQTATAPLPADATLLSVSAQAQGICGMP